MSSLRKLDTFPTSDTVNEVHPPSDPPKITVFRQVSEDDVDKIIKSSQTKSCLLDPWPTFLIKECIGILLPSLTKLVNCLSRRVVSLMPSKLLWSLLLLKRKIFLQTTLRIIALYLASVSYQNW